MKGMSHLNSYPRSRKSLAPGSHLFVITMLLFVFVLKAGAQQPPVTSVTAAQTPATSTAAEQKRAVSSGAVIVKTDRDDRYRIGPGDILDIRVFNKPILSRENVRVNGNGMIRMPLIDDDILAACRTEGELAKEIATRYLKYQRNPQVDVFVKEYQSQPVAVIGAVNQPSQFKLQRRVRLLELLAFANGIAERAGRSVNVVHGEPTGVVCQAATPVAEDDYIKTGLNSYKLKDTLDGVEQANPYIQPGDIIFVPDADMAYVVGNVIRPRTIPLRDPVTITQAIAMAEGFRPDSKKDKVRIVRQEPGSATKKEILVDLRAIEKRQAPDVVLQANDIVDVQVNSGKQLLKSFIGAVVPSIGQLPTRVVY
jgi:polysaccharide export outer membrane protein